MVLLQRSNDNTVCVIAYASRSLRPGEKSMKDYSSAKIELLALKWSVCKKFKDYLLGSKFTVYTDNNPLVYVKSSKLGAAQIRWLSELALYDFDIIYRMGKSNLVADALSHGGQSLLLIEITRRVTVMKTGRQYHIQLHTPVIYLKIQ